MRETVEMIVKALVDNVEAVEVREVPRAGSTMIEIRVAPDDMGKVIGRQGRTIKALRSLSYAVSEKQNHRFVLEIVESGAS
ncbi:MAG: uncharacterized protein QOD75_1210 [Blastocatellia bacterium]|jgi:predicted RNA-binding protein YlqC (UPF0109 family)|nr:uncharacterized protein [Blastocatellia bacterium]